MNELIPYVWIAIIIIATIVEFVTAAMLSVWFVPAALVAFIMSLLNISVQTQVIVFVVITLILIIMSKTLFKNMIKFKPQSTNIDYLIGKPALVTEQIDNMISKGIVKINGVDWTACSSDDEIMIDIGQIVYISAVEGKKLICETK